MTGEPLYPSTMRYRDRLSVAQDSAYHYNRMYTATQNQDVWGRLVGDATVRQSMSRSRPAYQEGGVGCRLSWKNSGFDSNTSPAQYTHTPFKQGHYQYGVPIEEQHIITATRFKQAQPLEFMTTIRRETETTNQAMRMLGTYPNDKFHAERMGIFIPQGCPGGKESYHADVRTGAFGLAPTLPRKGLGSSLRDGLNLK